MTQHLLVGGKYAAVSRPAPNGTVYLVACGRWVISGQSTGPAGVTCRACKRTM